MQQLGEAVLIPAGCPHQVRNLMVCRSFVMVFFLAAVICSHIRNQTEQQPVSSSSGLFIVVYLLLVYQC